MTKGPSEGIFREALTNLDLEPTFVYKPPDDARNWKPCDYMLWFPSPTVRPYPPGSAWFEVKEVAAIGTFSLAEIRPSQRRGIDTAKKLGIPYLLAIRWKRGGMWSIVDAIRLFDWLATQRPWPASVKRVMLESRFGVSCAPGQLSSMVRAALTEGL